METVRLQSTLYHFRDTASIFVEIRRVYPTPPAFGAPVRGDPVRISKIFGVRKLESLAYRMAFFA